MNFVCHNKLFTIGWTPKTQKYLTIIEPVLQELSKKYLLCLVTIGIKNYLINGVNVINLPWSEENEATLLHQFDVHAIISLPFFHREQRKSGYKLIQYMACGIPGVASPVGINTQIIEDKVDGLLAGTAKEWYEALEYLLTPYLN